MPQKTFITVLPVWVAYVAAGIVNLTVDQAIEIVTLLKEAIGLIAFILAALFTLYKFRKEWRGLDPRNKFRNKNKNEKE